MIERTFQNIPDGKISEADQQWFLVSLGWSKAATWQDLLQSRRILIISEAGAGKTYECQTQAQRLWDQGEAAFFVELSALANEDLRSLLDPNEEERLDIWLASQSDTATFFLDSIDELRLSLGSFERALKRLKKSTGNQLHRVRIVITTRPIPFDEQVIRRVLPVPKTQTILPHEERFAKIAMREQEDDSGNEKNGDVAPDWRVVALMPLSDTQINAFASDQGVVNPEQLQADLQRRNAHEFARRPQDLIELCADWREHKRIRTHRDQVATNIRIKLLPRDNRGEAAELSVEKAIEGASRLALAMQVTRRLTIRHNAASDDVAEDVALDPATILTDWNQNERKALLERPLFGFASYGRVRFHHRSVAEYLAAHRLLALRTSGMPYRALKRLLFAETKGKTIVRPSKRPIAGWLAIMESRVFELLRDHEPAVLLDEGDPESLTQSQRDQALQAYAMKYGPGGWRGISVPHIQVHRFASPELANVINQIWGAGVENPDVRVILITLIEVGRIQASSKIARDVACDTRAVEVERALALDALVALYDESLPQIAAGIASAEDRWPDKVARNAVLRLFPEHMSIEQLCQTVAWVKHQRRSVGSFSWQLPRLITTSQLEKAEIEALRDGLVRLISDGLAWQKQGPHVSSNRPYLSGALAAICMRGLEVCKDEAWLHASVLALRLHHRRHCDDEPIKALQKKLRGMSANDNERLFWVEDRLVQSLHKIEDPWRRLAEVTHYDGPVELLADRDLEWLMKALLDSKRDAGERAMLLEAAIRMPPDRDAWQKHVIGLGALVSDNPNLVARIEEWLKPSKNDREHRRWEKKAAERKVQEQRRKAKTRASWIQFWREVANQPEDAFSNERAWNTAWNLWKAMGNDGDNSRLSGWNRRFIEDQFDRETADRLRRALMTIWRKDNPTLASERPEGERGTFLIRWQLGLAGIYAEAEDADWAANLDKKDARLAARYAPIELNGLPFWMEALISSHPEAVDQTIGRELTWELEQAPGSQGNLNTLQGIENSPETIGRLFLPRLRSWLDAIGDNIVGSGN
ncbi:hypothetical protein ROE7235_03802 [Roseibaca ekhonensis]|uniref:Uncharacterized protein n=1 Tax=Roseinatronobacter ekhonensis TaxID=254356 RepID=A0A3B0MDS8_9RHOB|nr:ATP-binding protein [Roseibaca ekhonensis]SUZ34021.1 hypothetical protein ROE7235_03802 [Roseibaca ekhonensis]